MDKPTTKAKMQSPKRKRENPTLFGEKEADWISDQNDRKSANGFYFKYGLHSGAISWQ